MEPDTTANYQEPNVKEYQGPVGEARDPYRLFLVDVGMQGRGREEIYAVATDPTEAERKATATFLNGTSYRHQGTVPRTFGIVVVAREGENFAP